MPARRRRLVARLATTHGGSPHSLRLCHPPGRRRQRAGRASTEWQHGTAAIFVYNVLALLLLKKLMLQVSMLECCTGARVSKPRCSTVVGTAIVGATAAMIARPPQSLRLCCLASLLLRNFFCSLQNMLVLLDSWSALLFELLSGVFARCVAARVGTCTDRVLSVSEARYGRASRCPAIRCGIVMPAWFDQRDLCSSQPKGALQLISGFVRRNPKGLCG